MSWLPAMMFMRMLDDDEIDQPKQGQELEEREQIAIEIPQVRHCVLCMSVLLDELLSRAPCMECVRIACQCERTVTMVETETVLLVVVLVVVSDDAVAAFHGTRTVVEPVVFIHEIERTDVRHASNRLFETVEELSLAVFVLACVLQRELDDLSDVQTPLDSSEVDDETPCGFVFVDRGVYAALAHGVYSFFVFVLYI